MAKNGTSKGLKIISKTIFIIVIAVALFFGGKFAFKLGYEIMGKSTISEENSKIIEVDIPQGASTSQIAKILKENKLISSALFFRVEAKMSGNDGKFQFGKFKLNNSMSTEEIMEVLLTSGEKKETANFTIPEGYTVKQIAAKLAEEGLVNEEDFINTLKDSEFTYKFLKDVPDRDIKLQGYLFPDTYQVYKNATSLDIINVMLNQFNKIFKDEYYDRAKELGLTVDEVITIASIIEREVRVDSERKTVSGVIYNRLKTDMKLEMCSTVMFALDKPKDFKKDRLLYEDLEIDSPYNTYMYSGLPIGPIANPGEASIIAALYPEEHDYLFFVLKNEETGEHEFNKTLDEHNAAKAKYKQNY